MKANPTEAKTIALYFLETTQGVLRQRDIARTIQQVKKLLEKGYTSDEITITIDTLIGKGVNMYSFGYVVTIIDDVVLDIRKVEEMKRKEREGAIALEKQRELLAQRREEVGAVDETTERNRNKAERFNLQSRLRKKFDFDMFEGK